MIGIERWMYVTLDGFGESGCRKVFGAKTSGGERSLEHLLLRPHSNMIDF